MDLDLKYKTNIRDLFDEFDNFPEGAVIGIAREMQPVYRYSPLPVGSREWAAGGWWLFCISGCSLEKNLGSSGLPALIPSGGLNLKLVNRYEQNVQYCCGLFACSHTPSQGFQSQILDHQCQNPWLDSSTPRGVFAQLCLLRCCNCLCVGARKFWLGVLPRIGIEFEQHSGCGSLECQCTFCFLQETLSGQLLLTWACKCDGGLLGPCSSTLGPPATANSAGNHSGRHDPVLPTHGPLVGFRDTDISRCLEKLVSFSLHCSKDRPQVFFLFRINQIIIPGCLNGSQQS